MRIIYLDDVVLPRVNKRFYKNFSLTKEYKEGKELFKTEILRNMLECNKKFIEPDYRVDIIVHTYNDIDSFIKPLLDSMKEIEIIDDDRNIVIMNVVKIKVKRNAPSKLAVYLAHCGGVVDHTFKADQG